MQRYATWKFGAIFPADGGTHWYERKKKCKTQISRSRRNSPLLRLFFVKTQRDERGFVALALAALSAQSRHAVPGGLQLDRSQPSGLGAALHAKRDLVIVTAGHGRYLGAALCRPDGNTRTAGYAGTKI